ncbi:MULTISPECIES: polysaccharide pyruvyl transferase family protein [unclassified Paracoccus (in: a-proteobacteria)]|uniref:polysaccharide pyruvyl transferase family protein n=1 Tax=unclassified Paracoccus (in: a-proteobacteria) TaxID=2688777 RepID=UPI001600FEB4|nr:MULTISPECIES: polysaccharide pyruvyl transferase family protein [unclassified Paracoccus (in: a-proteobacteria)]MBB1489965.1 polysaccharide pyruvyl transferase family protein [Paracoccus sp. MC1854]MBB1496552.1 polysaccharide pyruvyl transferase family protein [Paracoccus sp. MC1862]QQO43577.1 polysaccharide pyruvyl transferase family protein [Paracoccus sp. MC1862]
MRVGVLTFHRCINYGSYWQARCLVEAIAARGHDAVLLDHHSCEVTSREWRYAFQPLTPQRSPRADVAQYGRKLRKFLDAFQALPLSAPFDLEAPEAMLPVDLAVIGSDEVLNLSHPWYGGKPVFWGEGIAALRVVTYAASFGNYAAGFIEPQWMERLRNLDAISVRDDNSRELVAGATGQEPAMVLDPVLLNPPRVEAAWGPPYLLVYGHHVPDWFAARVQNSARARGFRTISVGYRNDWADEQRLDAGPQEFAALVAGAEAVATTYFHGCCFALVNGKPLVCAPSDYRWTKVRDLTALLGAERHLTFEDRDPADVTALLAEPVSDAIQARIADLRAQSAAWLDAALAGRA